MPSDALPAASWELYPELPLAALDAALPDLTRLQMQILANRGILGASAARAFVQSGWHALHPAPAGLDLAVARLRQAAASGERVVVFGDYDVDGITSCAVMLQALRTAGCDAHPYLPTRDDDGRGPSAAAVRSLASQGTRLLVTTDCGVSNVDEVRLATALGMDVLVTDHHPPQGALAPALAIVNPRQPGCPSPEKNLAGVGVAFRVAEALLANIPDPQRDAALAALLDLVAVGTIGDVVPLTPENWRLARAGLHRLNRDPQAGLRALLVQVGLQPGFVVERDISFAIAPRLNAAGRMDNPMLALQLLLTNDPAVAADLARQLQTLNEKRQQATEMVMAQAREQVLTQVASGQAGPVLARGEDWPLGIIGLVAGRLADEFGRPALVVSCGMQDCRGSVRGPEDSQLVAMLARRADLFRHFGGHAQAAGFTLPREKLDDLLSYLRTADAPPLAEDVGETRATLVAAVESLALADEVAPLDATEEGIVAASAGMRVAPPLRVDCRLPLRRVLTETYAAMRALAPFGPGFAPPIFLAPHVRVVRCWRSGPEGRNLRLALREGSAERNALWSRQGALLPILRDIGVVDVVYTFDAFPPRPGAAAEYTLRILALRPAE
jgi:single-stranded-DNA-specific exonuclease